MVKPLLKFLLGKLNRTAKQCDDYSKGTFNSGP